MSTVATTTGGVPSKSMPDIKADPETVWMRVKWLAPTVIATGLVVMLYMDMRYAIKDIVGTIDRDAKMRSSERDSLILSVNEVRDELRRVFVDSVATRQAQAWIDLARALNRDKNPTVVWPDLPR